MISDSDRRELSMRLWLLLAGGFLATGCGSLAAPVSSPLTYDRPLPDYRPETAAVCNSVGLSITYGRGGLVTVNGRASDMAALMTAAGNKNSVCPNAPAVVNLSLAPGVPDAEADDLRARLAAVITNLALSEAD
jgi:hypothetical protein